MYGFSTEEWSKLNPDQKFYWFFHDWAKRQGKIFLEEYCDGYQPEGLIDGMEVDDVWGWLVDSEDEVDDEYFGCLEWSLDNGELKLSWHVYEDYSDS